MKLSKEVRRVTKELFRSSFTNEQLDAEKVRGFVGQIVAGKPRHYVDILKYYHRLIRLELDKRHAIIESATLVQAQAALDVAAKHLSSLEAVSRKATLAQSEGAMLSAKGKYLGAEAQVSYTEVRSPIAGVVTDRPLFAGETAAAGTPLITIMDTTVLLAKMHLSQSVAQLLKVGDTGSLTLPGIAEPVEARVSLVSPALDPGSTTLEVWLRLDNHAGRYKVGTPVKASVAGQTTADALLAPAGAVLTDQDGGKYVMLLHPDGTAHKRLVKVGITDADHVQILDGLAASDTVISSGAYGLDDGTRVQVGPAGGNDK